MIFKVWTPFAQCIFKKKIIHFKYVVNVSKHNQVDADDISHFIYIYFGYNDLRTLSQKIQFITEISRKI